MAYSRENLIESYVDGSYLSFIQLNKNNPLCSRQQCGCKIPHKILFVNAASKGLAVDEKTGKIYFISGFTVEAVNADGSGRSTVLHYNEEFKRLAVDPIDG